MQISQRVQAIKESPTLAISAKAQQMKADGIDVITLSAGEPDFDTPQHIKDAAVAALANGFTKYTAVTGTAGLKKAIIAKFERDNYVSYKPEEIIVSVGGKHSFYNLCMAYLNRGDEVIIPAPFWVSYPDMVVMAEGVPVIVSCGIEQQYKLTATQLEKAITPKTRLLVINSPCNPTGALYALDELKSLSTVLLRYPQILIASDDMYEHILLGEDRFCNILNAEPRLKNQTILLNGVSKAYSMTGWRIGYAGGPSNIVRAMGSVQSQSTSNPCSIAQVAAEIALNGDQSCLQDMLDAFKRRYQFIFKRFNAIRGLKCLPTKGTFYAFIDAQVAIKNLHAEGKITVKNDLCLCDYLLNQYLVAVVPGSTFGLEGYFRISFATNLANLEKALDRIEEALK